ncbi:MAG: hypothetical protein HDT39_11595 [Lachnospiraceae bacterium]|nr:hypothetical protein [Lachnospiraceae bacterium]
MVTRNEELAAFLRWKHSEIGEMLHAIEPRLKIPETDQNIIYENENQNIQITYSFKGAFQGNVYLYIDSEQKSIFSQLQDFAKYLELCRRNNKEPKYITKYLIELQQKADEWDKPELPTEKSKLISFLNEEDRIMFDNKSEIKMPNRLIVDGEEWSTEGVSYKTANQILEKLYSGQYARIEVTYQEFYERKGRMLPLNMTSLVYLCEDGKMVMQYFEEKELYTGIYFENRNKAGLVDSDLLPHINFRGKDILEQNIVLDIGILGELCREMFICGCIDYDENGGRSGFFERKYFSNKNAYTKYRDEKGEFA